ncbi:short neuropeptide F [Eurosta solidaginis]|uniref:short neuropeptide F n=1 Tax=Eurosta solidaginis TaxID=178769 RepID=UPI003530AF5F
MLTPHHLLNAVAFICLSAILCQQSNAIIPDNSAINNLYDNLLQREYAGPVVFPNHQVERKAQRSPSLRLRFGRRSDPDMFMPAAEKRWFGDVNQKPIRSPSLRLRFGRRSDPNMPLHSELDVLMNSLGTGTAGGSANGAFTDVEDAPAYFADEYPEDLYENAFERVMRKPQRLRFGRSLSNMQNNVDNELEHARQQQQQTDELLDYLLTSKKLRNILLSLRQQYEPENLNDEVMGPINNNEEFEREARKPAPLRLRFGRSTGGVAETQEAGTTQNIGNLNKDAGIGAEYQQTQTKN